MNGEKLRQILHRIDGRGYKAYKDIQGAYRFARYTLFIDHVQGDPFASPSKIRLRVSGTVAGFPGSLHDTPVRRMALADYLARQVARAIRSVARQHRGSGKSGLIAIDSGGQEVLERTAVKITPEWVEARLYVGLPAAGRTVLARQAEEIFFKELPAIVQQSLFWESLNQSEARHFVHTVENQEFIREQLSERGLVAFVANGAILPRESGASDRPMSRREAVPFQSPASLEVTFQLPHPVDGPDGEQTILRGMGIPEGITLIVGGGYHGKSTLLNAIERGVYPHIPGDGREYVVTRRDAVKIRAEDGRRVEMVDISPFISNLPYGRSTSAFCTDDASGSTSQAANILEALEVGARVLLLDEDTSATNFMIRDARMQALVHKDREPITPFIDRVKELHQRLGVSTILVMGGSGDYLDVADTVILMHNYLPEDVTESAREVARAYPTRRKTEIPAPMTSVTERIPLASSFDPSKGKKEVKIQAKTLDAIQYGTQMIELRALEQLVDISQTRAIGYAIHLATRKYMDDRRTLREVLDLLDNFFQSEGLDALDPFRRGDQHPGSFARPRRFEIAAAINRLRTLRMRQKT
ncbi:MAG: ABC-ATPase domain-containing protein [Calditrichaeota bacterium]|nr:ABC-ATPase domain-containing protein [Calditrichota bacterium]